jgi:thiol-disulfide isomerase/thioredoxin
MNRRTWIYSTVGVAAAAIGAAAARFVNKPGEPISAEAQEFWRLSLDSPDGQNVVLSSFKGKPLLVNFWATWCPPCIEELPELNAFYLAQRSSGFQVLGLAVDQPSAVRKWLAAKPLSFPVAMAGLEGTQLSKTLGNLSGGLPFSVVFGANGTLLHRKTGKVNSEDLAQWATLR